MGCRCGRIDLGFRIPAELPQDVPGQGVDCEQVVDPVQPTVALKRTQIRKGHLRAQCGEVLGGRATILHDLRAELENVLGKQFAPRNLDHEGALESEGDVKEVDRFCA